jgi:dihydroorotase
MQKNITCDLVLKNGTAVLPQGIMATDIAIYDGRIVGFGNYSADQVKSSIDCTGLHILPGVIDTQVHFREPGAEHKETFETGTMAAALGGITAVFEMPNTNPLTTTPEALNDKMQRAAQSAWTDYAFYLGATAQNAQYLTEWEKLPGVCGIKIFMGASTGDLLTSEDAVLESIIAHGKRIVAVHAEDEQMMQANKQGILGDSHDVGLHPVWRSPESCLSATTRIVAIARKYGRKVHILHVTTQEEMTFLASHKDIASVEVLPNHLTLAAPDCYKRLGTLAQQNPPIREQHHQDALWQAIADGTVDIVASDHAPHTREEKAKPYPQSPSGTPGVQTMLPIMLNHVHEGRLTLERLVDVLCYGPSRLHQIACKGRIARGYDADFTIVDLQKKHTITHAQQRSKAGWTPFDGMQVTGWPVMTIIRGELVMRDDELMGAPKGKPVRFRDGFIPICNP